MKISASVVTYHSDLNELARLLNCISNSVIDNIYIVDNSESDILREFVNVYSKIEYCYGHGNIGYGSAHNIAIRKSIESGAKYHIVINPDIYFEQGAIEKMVEFIDSSVDIGQVMPKVVYPNGELQYLCKLLPTPFDLIGRRFFSFFPFAKKRNDFFELRNSGYDKILNVPYLSGCFMLLRISSIKEIGFFDEKIFMYGEDIDYSRRMHQKYKTIYYPEVKIVHAHKQESYTSKKMLMIHIKSIIYYFNKWGWIFDKERSKVNRYILDQLK